MKIVLLCHKNLFKNPRGGEKSSLEIIKYLQNIGYDCTVIQRDGCNCTRIGFLEKTCECDGIKIISCNMKLPVVEAILTIIKPDLILTWGRAVALTYELPYPYITFVRTWLELDRFENMGDMLYKAVRVIGNCEVAMNRLNKRYPNLNATYSDVPVIVPRLNNHTPTYILSIEKDGIYNIALDLAPLFPDEKFLVIDYAVTEEIITGNITKIPYTNDMKSIWEKTKIVLNSADDRVLAGRIPIESQMLGIPCLNQFGAGAEEWCKYNIKGLDIKEWQKKLASILKNYKKSVCCCKKYVYENYDRIAALDVVRIEIEKIYNKKKALIFLDAGIGNIVEKTHSINALYSMGYLIDAVIDSPHKDLIESMPAINKVIDKPIDGYDKYISFNHMIQFHPGAVRIAKDETVSEREWGMKVVRDMGYEGDTPKASRFIFKKKYFDIPDDAVVFVPGCVSKEWMFKGYPNYEKLISYFKHPIVIGTSNDISPIKYDYIDMPIMDAISLILQSQLLISHDSGMTHIASALGKQNYSIFGPTSRIKNLPQCTEIIEKECECSPCQYTDMFFKCNNPVCMDINPEDIITRLKEDGLGYLLKEDK